MSQEVVLYIAQTYDKGVALPRVNLDRIHSDGMVINAVRLDNVHEVVINGENVIRVAGHIDEAEPIAERSKSAVRFTKTVVPRTACHAGRLSRILA